MNGVVLYGPPAAGKDTTAAALEVAGHGFRRFHRIKSGPGRTNGYRMVDHDKLGQLVAQAGEAVWTTKAYGATYVVDRSHLLAMLASDEHPIVQLGETEAVDAVLRSTPDARWTVVELWCPRHVALQRIEHRQTGDLVHRIERYDQTPHLVDAHLRLDTSQLSVARVVQAISNAVYQSA
jgi:guanylate kinase